MKKKHIRKCLLSLLLVLSITLSGIPVAGIPAGQAYATENVSEGSEQISQNHVSDNENNTPEEVLQESLIEENTGLEDISGFALKAASVSENEGTVSQNESAVSDNEVAAGVPGLGNEEPAAAKENSRMVNYEEEEIFGEVPDDLRPKADQIIDFMVVLDKEPLLDAFTPEEIRGMGESVTTFVEEQNQLIASVTQQLQASFGGQAGFEIGNSHTISTTAIAVTTKYGNQEAIKAMEGVAEVYVAPTFRVASRETGLQPFTNNSHSMIGGIELNNLDYTGKGMKVAIIDTGIVLEHPNFQKMSDDKLTDTSMTKEFVNSIWELTNARKQNEMSLAYQSNKIPFAFNYATGTFDVSHRTANHDHGTHVAGITAANKIASSDVVGIAPDAQVIVMQVFNTSGGAEWSTIISALEDCVILGVDVANLSLGSAAGFTDGDKEMNAVLDRFKNTETNVLIAAGNDTNNALMNLLGTDMSKTKNTDNGLIGTPATAPGALSVASADNDGAILPYFEVNGEKYGFTDTSESTLSNFLDVFKTRTLEFVAIDGVGDAGDYEGKNVEGKIALVARGDISFQQKQTTAKEKGAIGLIVYNNVAGNFSMAIHSGEGHIPAVSISKTEGEKLKAMQEGQLTVCNYGETVKVRMDKTMSSFSSWGVTPDLKLKPEITGVGGNIYSTRDPEIGGSNYGNMSGTSMATPHVAGAMAILQEYLRKNTDLSGRDLGDAAVNLIMSTANQMEEGETLYSPRNQGAGLVDLVKATSAYAFLSSPETFNERPKGEMGDDDTREGKFSFDFTIHNISEETKTYGFQAITMTAKVDDTGKYMTNSNKNLGAALVVKQGSEVKENISVEAGKEVTLTAEITLSQADKEYIDTYYEYGCYVEGYLYADDTKEGAVTLSMPFLGFYGDWSDSPVFDDEGEEASLNAPTIKKAQGRLGQNPYISGGKSGDKYNAISIANPIEEMVFGLMRNARRVVQTVTSKDGNDVYFSWGENYIVKTHYNTSYGMIVPYNLLLAPDYNVYIWDGTDNGKQLPNNTQATYTISTYLDDGDDKVDDVYSFDVTIDNSAPVVENAATMENEIIKDKEKGSVVLPITMKDNHYIAAVLFEDFSGNILAKFEVTNKPGESVTNNYEVTGYGTDFKVVVADYAGNEEEIELSLDLSDMPVIYSEPIELDKERIYGFETYTDGYVNMGWFSADKANFSNLKNETYTEYSGVLNAGEYINGYVIGQRYSDGALLLYTPYSSYWNSTIILEQTDKGMTESKPGFVTLYDMAMNYNDNTLYAIGWEYQGDSDGNGLDDGSNSVFKIKLEEEVAIEEVTPIQGTDNNHNAMTLGITTAGKAYTITTDGKLHELDLTNGELTEIGETEFVNTPNYSGVNVIQSMCFDHKTGEMYWYAHSQTYSAGTNVNVGGMYKVDLQDAGLTQIAASNNSGYTSLFIPSDQEAENLQFRVEPTELQLNPSEVKLVAGQSKRMSVKWLPWNSTPVAITWSTEDPSIATVNSNGKVTALSSGETYVVATVTLGEEVKSFKAKINVLSAADEMYGFVIVDNNGKVANSSWITYSASDLNNAKTISGPGGMIQGGAYYEEYVYYVVAKQEPYEPVDTEVYRAKVNKGTTSSETTIGPAEKIHYLEDVELGNLGFDYNTGRMYGVDYTNGGLVLLDIDSGEVDFLGTFTGDLGPMYMTAMCVTRNGNIVGSDISGNLYQIDPDTMRATKLYSIGVSTMFYAAMTYDYNSDTIYWNPCNGDGASDMYMVTFKDEEVITDVEAINIGAINGSRGAEQTVMFTIPEDEPDTTYIQATKVTITNGEDLIHLKGGRIQLKTVTEPLRPSVKPRQWTSGNTQVATVDKKGLVSLVGVGTTTITVKVENKGETPNPAYVEDTINITVHDHAGEFLAFLAEDESGSGYFDYWINLKDYEVDKAVTETRLIGTYTLRTGEYFDGFVYAYNDQEQLYRIDADNPVSYVAIGPKIPDANERVISMAYNYDDGEMYGVTLSKKLVTIDLTTGSVEEKATLNKRIDAIAADEKGTLFGVGSEEIYATSYLYAINEEDGSCEQISAILPNEGGLVYTGANYMSERMYSPQMTYDYGTKRLYLNATIRDKAYNYSNKGFILIQLADDDNADGELTKKKVEYVTNLGKPALEFRGSSKVGNLYLGVLCAVPEEGELTVNKVIGLRMNRESARLVKGNTTTLTAEVIPSGLPEDVDQTVTWSTNAANIASVDSATGVVTGVSAGVATITATSNSNSKAVATCQVTVVEGKGEGASKAYTISGDLDKIITFDPEVPKETVREIGVLNGGKNVVGMAMKDANSLYYLTEAAEDGPFPILYTYNLNTQQKQRIRPLYVFIGDISDMAYDPVEQQIYVASGFYIFQFDARYATPTEDLMPWTRYMDTTKRPEMPISHLQALTVKDSEIYFVASENKATMYKTNVELSSVEKVRDINVNTVAGSVEMDYDSSTGQFYITDAGDRLYTFTITKNGENFDPVQSVDVVGDFYDVNGLAIWPGSSSNP